MTKPQSTADLAPSEERLIRALHRLRFGRIEHLRIKQGEVVLDPGPKPCGRSSSARRSGL